ncbi:MAG TPA: hypothetical protein VIF15_04845 [Polyangiaceae bacterium]|jgi:hypothetical protein
MALRPPPTPRAQLARVLVGATLAAVLGAGPALAWDLSTQLPRSHDVPTPWARPSPWLTAGKQMKSAMGGLAREYLPHTRQPPDPSSLPAVPPPATTPASSVTVGMYGLPVPPAPSPVVPIEIE